MSKGEFGVPEFYINNNKCEKRPFIKDTIIEYLPMRTIWDSDADGFRYLLYMSIDQSVDTEL